MLWILVLFYCLWRGFFQISVHTPPAWYLPPLFALHGKLRKCNFNCVSLASNCKANTIFSLTGVSNCNWTTELLFFIKTISTHIEVFTLKKLMNLMRILKSRCLSKFMERNFSNEFSLKVLEYLYLQELITMNVLSLKLHRKKINFWPSDTYQHKKLIKSVNQ